MSATPIAPSVSPIHPGYPSAISGLDRESGAPAGPFRSPGFGDVPAEHPFFAEIAWAAQNGIAGGFADGGFHPGACVSRQAAAAFLARTFG